ncbi:MAG: MMPL family transporter [Trueperaceae bacterium]
MLAIWLLAIGLSLPGAARIDQVLTAQAELDDASEAVQVSRTVAERFPGDDAEATVLLIRPARDATDADAFAADRDVYLDALRSDPALSDVRNVADLLPVRRSDLSYLGQLLYADADLTEAQRAVRDARTLALDHPDLRVALAGSVATTLELQEVSGRDARRGEAFGLPLSLLVLAVAFGALVAAGLPLLVAATTISVTLGLLFVVGQVLPFAVFTQSIVTMLGLATGIDYALLMTNRFREELRAGRPPREAAEVTAANAGRAVTFSGLTVMVALSALLVPPLPYIRSVGVGTMAVLLVSVLVASTALPALLTLLGHRVNWLRITRREPGVRTRGFWRGRALAIMRRPWAYTLVGGAGLLALTLPTATMNVADPGALGLAPGTEARQVVSALNELELGGLLGTATVLVDVGEGGFFGPVTPRNVSRLVREVQGLPSVGAVVSPFAVQTIPRLLLLQYYVDEDLARGSEVAPLAAATVGREGRYVQLQVIPERDLPPGEMAQLEAGLREAVRAAGFEATIGGTALFEAEWSRVLYGAFPAAAAIVVIVTLLILGVAFRSIVIPIKSVLLNAMTVAAAYGVITLIFQHGIGAGLLGLDGGMGFIDSNVPLFVFAIVFGLSMDYEVFLVSRIYENHLAGMSDHDAVATAMESTGSVITSAAAVMLVVFGVFFFSEVVLIKTLGVGLAVAVLLDATLVRLTLVPAVMTLAGRWNWWLPASLARLADRIGLRH